MATAADLMGRIRAAGANVVMDGDRLRLVNGKKLPPDALAYIKRNAKQVADWLANEGDFEERAAIVEHDGGLNRSAAENLSRLLFSHPPAGVDATDWSWFVGHAAKIMDGSTELRSGA